MAAPTLSAEQLATITSVSTSQLSTLKLRDHLTGSENWGTWKTLLKDWLAINDVEEWVDESSALSRPAIAVAATTGPPATAGITTVQEKGWKKADRQILATIRRWVDATVMKHIQSAQSALEAWQRLHSLYQPTDIPTVIRIYYRFRSYRMLDGETVEEHLGEMQVMYDRLREINTEYATPLDWAVTLAASLPSSWDEFLPTLNTDLKRLSIPAQREEVARAIQSKILAEGRRRESYAQEEKALAARFERSKTNTNSDGPKARKPGKCNFCKKPGHWASECRSKEKVEKKKM